VSGLLKVVVEPTEEDFLWREGKEVIQSFSIL